jgi:hypothetical protein
MQLYFLSLDKELNILYLCRSIEEVELKTNISKKISYFELIKYPELVEEDPPEVPEVLKSRL